jgi:ribosomal protein S27E
MAQGVTVGDMPQDTWDRFVDRCGRDHWQVQTLIVQLIDDYGAGRITPSSDPAGTRAPGFLKVTCSQNHTNEVCFAKESVRSAQPDAPVRCPTCGDVIDLSEHDRLQLLVWAHTEDASW